MTTTMTQPQQVGQSGRMDDVPEPEVPERARRRRFTAKYKADVLAEYEAADRAGKGALLRREGLYSSSIASWLEQRDKGALEALGKPSGAPTEDPAQREVARLRKEVGRLTGELDKARQVIEIQSKLSALLDTLATDSSRNTSEK